MPYSPDQLMDRLKSLPRFPLAHLPTPFEFLPRFTAELGGPRIWIKRDDCTGLAFGGNKTRHAQLLIGDAIQKEADLVIWGAGIQSNNCRQTAAACAKAGLDCHLVLGRGRPADGDDERQGNLLLDHLVGASIEIVDEAEGPDLDRRIAESAERFRQRGRSVYERDPKRVKPLAALSYIECMVEVFDQATSAEVEPTSFYVCSSGSTGAGISLAMAALGKSMPVNHITPIVWPWDTRQSMVDIANAGGELIDIETRLNADELIVSEEYVGEAYGIPTPECLEAIALLARTEGILLDPSYSGKSMSALVDHVRQGKYSSNDDLVFIHTGGTPALFAYNRQLTADIPARSL